MSRVFLLSLLVLPILWSPGLLRAQGGTQVLSSKMAYGASGAPQITFNTHGQPSKNTVSNKIQLGLMYYAYAMNQIEESQRTNLLNQAQKIVSQVATVDGLKRPNILQNNPILNLAKGETKGQGYDLSVNSVSQQGNMLEVKPLGDNGTLLGPSVFYLFQDLIKVLPDEGLRLTVLALGGMNKWYRELGKASDPNSLSQAPAYGLNLAVDIISKLSGQRM